MVQSQWPRGLRHRPAAARLLGLGVQIPSGAWMSVSFECCVVRLRSLWWADHSSRGVLPSVVHVSVILKPQQWGNLGPSSHEKTNIYMDINRSLLQKIKCLFVPIFLILLMSRNFLNHPLILSACNLCIFWMYKVYGHVLLHIHKFKSN